MENNNRSFFGNAVLSHTSYLAITQQDFLAFEHPTISASGTHRSHKNRPIVKVLKGEYNNVYDVSFLDLRFRKMLFLVALAFQLVVLTLGEEPHPTNVPPPPPPINCKFNNISAHRFASNVLLY